MVGRRRRRRPVASVARRFASNSAQPGRCRAGRRRRCADPLGQSSWLLHTTMAAMGERLGAGQFLRLHRSSIVRKSFIARMLDHEGRWCAELSDESTQRIANRTRRPHCARRRSPRRETARSRWRQSPSPLTNGRGERARTARGMVADRGGSPPIICAKGGGARPARYIGG